MIYLVVPSAGHPIMIGVACGSIWQYVANVSCGKCVSVGVAQRHMYIPFAPHECDG